MEKPHKYLFMSFQALLEMLRDSAVSYDALGDALFAFSETRTYVCDQRFIRNALPANTFALPHAFAAVFPAEEARLEARDRLLGILGEAEREGRVLWRERVSEIQSGGRLQAFLASNGLAADRGHFGFTYCSQPVAKRAVERSGLPVRVVTEAWRTDRTP